jgi:hypothetical protein
MTKTKFNWWCFIFGHDWHYSSGKGMLAHHEGYDDCYFCEICGKKYGGKDKSKDMDQD